MSDNNDDSRPTAEGESIPSSVDPNAPPSEPTESERVLYLTSVQCEMCQRFHTFAHEGPPVPLDQDAPWPDVDLCPHCGSEYPDDLAEVITEVTEAERTEPYDTDSDRCGGDVDR